jgi:hypothetical protein
MDTMNMNTPHQLIMDAASLLNSIEEDPLFFTGDDTVFTMTMTQELQAPQRYLPANKKPDAAPTFPEKVSYLLAHVLFNLADQIKKGP